MTYQSDPQHPWIFHRDEVDLLEEDIEDIYRGYQEQPKTQTVVEDQVLKEQLETEELSDAELVLKMGSKMFDLEDRSCGVDHNDNESFAVPLRPHVNRNPLYIHTRTWAQEVYRFAKDTYHNKQVHSRDIFRVYINVNMIPIKLSIAQTEEMQEDPLAFEIAEKEYVLVLTYLDRVLESLEKIQMQSLTALDELINKGKIIRAEIFRVYQQLIDRKDKKRPDNFL